MNILKYKNVYRFVLNIRIDNFSLEYLYCNLKFIGKQIFIFRKYVLCCIKFKTGEIINYLEH